MFTIDNNFCRKNGIKNNKTLWYSVESDEQNLQAFTIMSNKISNASSGEHNF